MRMRLTRRMHCKIDFQIDFIKKTICMTRYELYIGKEGVSMRKKQSRLHELQKKEPWKQCCTALSDMRRKTGSQGGCVL